MNNTNLAYVFPELRIHRIFTEAQLQRIEELNLPKVLRFLLADKFDDKFVHVGLDKWKFMYGGHKVEVDFHSFDMYEKKLIKYFLCCYAQINSPYNFRSIVSFIAMTLNEIENNINKFTFITFKEILIQISKENEALGEYCVVKFLIRMAITEGFEGFTEENEDEFEIIPRPKSTHSKLYYQELEEIIPKPTITMIQHGFAKLNADISQNYRILDDTLKNASILGLIYCTGMRPIQIAKLSVEDLKIDTYSDEGEFMRYSLLVPYAKQAKYHINKIPIKIPEEIASVILKYIQQYNLEPNDQLFSLGNNAVQSCTIAINKQVFEFSPSGYQNQVNNKELIHLKLTSSQFRHYVASTMAMSGASAEDIAFILGHSVLKIARHYISSSPHLAQIRAKALGKNPLYQQIVAMLMTGDIILEDQNAVEGQNIAGFMNNTLYVNIGKCGYKSSCFLEPVRSCYGCVYFHPYQDGEHWQVLQSVQEEIESIVKISDATYHSRNPIISVHESTKFEIESVIKRCELHKEKNDE